MCISPFAVAYNSAMLLGDDSPSISLSGKLAVESDHVDTGIACAVSCRQPANADPDLIGLVYLDFFVLHNHSSLNLNNSNL